MTSPTHCQKKARKNFLTAFDQAVRVQMSEGTSASAGISIFPAMLRISRR